MLLVSWFLWYLVHLHVNLGSESHKDHALPFPISLPLGSHCLPHGPRAVTTAIVLLTFSSYDTTDDVNILSLSLESSGCPYDMDLIIITVYNWGKEVQRG